MTGKRTRSTFKRTRSSSARKTWEEGAPVFIKKFMINRAIKRPAILQERKETEAALRERGIAIYYQRQAAAKARGIN